VEGPQKKDKKSWSIWKDKANRAPILSWNRKKTWGWVRRKGSPWPISSYYKTG